jgi:uncharacterized protein (TIGR00369 family)
MKTGLERFKPLEGQLMDWPMGQLFQLYLDEVADGFAIIGVMPDARFNNHMARVHGGFAATLLDTALGTSVLTKLPCDTALGTTSLTVFYVRKIDADTGRLTAIGQVLHAGRTTLTAEAKLVDADGKLYAHASGSFLVYPT